MHNPEKQSAGPRPTAASDPDSVFLQNLNRRTGAFRRNVQLEELLAEMQGLLEPAEQTLAARFTQPKHPVLLVVGNPRSGTTLLMQMLAASGQFAYPSNLLSRFYYAPALGARIERLLTDPAYDYKGEMGNMSRDQNFSSALGKTSGALSPSEFFHFWRRFIPNYDPQHLDAAAEERIDKAGMAADVAAIEAVYGKPFAMKAMVLQYNIAALRSVFDRVLIVYLKRHPFYVMQSIVQAREQFYGTRDMWWSVKPAEYEELKKLDPLRQIAGQVYYTTRALEGGMAALEPASALTVDYDDLCRRPGDVFGQIAEKYARAGSALSAAYGGPAGFDPSSKIKLPASDVESLLVAYEEFSGERLSL